MLHHRLRPTTPTRTRWRARSWLVVPAALAVLVAAVGPAAGQDDPVGRARAALDAATQQREQAEARVREAEANLARAEAEAARLAGVDAQLTAELASARAALREYAIAAYIDGGQSEIFRATLDLEQAQALAWQSDLLLGQSVSADETAARFEALRQANEPATVAAATEVDRARVELTDARNDLIQSSAFERDAESALAAATEARRREQAVAAAAAAAAARAEAAASSGGGGGSSTGTPPAGGAGGGSTSPPGRGNPTPAESATLARIRQCESRGNYSIVSASGRYRGAYQFDFTTWRGVGGTGDPAAASPAEQDYRALLLLRMRGTRPWPICGR